MAKSNLVTGELYASIIGKLFEIGRQLRQPKGYPFDAEKLNKVLQLIIEGEYLGWDTSQLSPMTVRYGEHLIDSITGLRKIFGKIGVTLMNLDSVTIPIDLTGATEVDLVLRTPRSLGMHGQHIFVRDFYTVAKENGLEFCPTWSIMENIIATHQKDLDNGSDKLRVIHFAQSEAYVLYQMDILMFCSLYDKQNYSLETVNEDSKFVFVCPRK